MLYDLPYEWPYKLPYDLLYKLPRHPAPAGRTRSSRRWSRGHGPADYFPTEGSGQSRTRTAVRRGPLPGSAHRRRATPPRPCKCCARAPGTRKPGGGRGDRIDRLSLVTIGFPIGSRSALIGSAVPISADQPPMPADQNPISPAPLSGLGSLVCTRVHGHVCTPNARDPADPAGDHPGRTRGRLSPGPAAAGLLPTRTRGRGAAGSADGRAPRRLACGRARHGRHAIRAARVGPPPGHSGRAGPEFTASHARGPRARVGPPDSHARPVMNMNMNRANPARRARRAGTPHTCA
ncbi:hypothetical protein GCM10010232_70860 [Streptomyces amakusaensis]